MIGSKFYKKDSCDNSFAWVKENLDSAPDGSVFICSKLTHARGRDGRVWKIYPGQLLATILLKPQNASPSGDELNFLNMAITLGILGPIKKFGVGLKWPNDFIINEKKIGGLLIEAVWHKNEVLGVIIGFGLNVNNIFLPSDELFEIATSLKQNGHTVNEQKLFDEIINSLNFWYGKWHDKLHKEIFSGWLANQVYVGKNITVHLKDGSTLNGMIDGFEENGDLKLKTNGETKRVSFYVVEDIRGDIR